MSQVSLRNVTKIFRTFKRAEGLAGALKNIFIRRYEHKRAVDNISLEMEEGELVGYIGPNGAGKSTTVKILSGIIRATSGEVQVLGMNPYRERIKLTKHYGVVFGQRTQLWWDLAPIESFRLLQKIYEVPKEQFRTNLERFIDILELKEFLNIPVRKLSLGQKMRCDFAAALLHSPKILFLDEPTIGLDIQAKERVREFIRSANQNEKTTVILTTHDLSDIEQLSRRLVIIDEGKIIYDGTPQGIKETFGHLKRIIFDLRDSSDPDLSRMLNDTFGLNISSHFEENRLEIRYDTRNLKAKEIIEVVLDSTDVVDLTMTEPRIETIIREIYLRGIKAPSETSQKPTV